MEISMHANKWSSILKGRHSWSYCCPKSANLVQMKWGNIHLKLKKVSGYLFTCIVRKGNRRPDHTATYYLVLCTLPWEVPFMVLPIVNLTSLNWDKIRGRIGGFHYYFFNRTFVLISSLMWILYWNHILNKSENWRMSEHIKAICLSTINTLAKANCVKEHPSWQSVSFTLKLF